jgi:hypothetical protein
VPVVLIDHRSAHDRLGLGGDGEREIVGGHRRRGGSKAGDRIGGDERL